MSALAQRSTPVAPAEARLRIKPANPVFTDSVLADLRRISETATGRALFRRVRDAGRTVTIEKPDPPTDPPNAWTLPRSLGNPSTEIVIAYDPADWPSPARLGSLPSDVVLFGRLEDAVAMATGAEIPGEPAATVSPAMEAYLRQRTAIPEPPARAQP